MWCHETRRFGCKYLLLGDVFFFQSLNYIDHKQKLVRCTEIEVVLSSQSQLFSVGAQFLALLFFLFSEKDKLDLENQI